MSELTPEGSLMNESCGTGAGFYGWQKKCLFIALLVLSLLVLTNITLVLWIIKVFQLNTDGMNSMNMVGSGLQFNDHTYIMDTLMMTRLFTRPGQTVSVQGSEHITLQATDRNGNPASSIVLDQDGLDINTPKFKVKDLRGKTFFSLDKDTVSLTAKSLAISGEGGAMFEGSLQTSIVSADIRSDLLLEAAMKGVQTVTPAGVSVESRAGDIQATSNRDFNLITVDGSIKLESGNVMLKSLKNSQTNHHSRKHHQHQEKIYQLCVCGGGELYLAEPEISCEAAADLELC